MSGGGSLRLDKWLWHARFVRRRPMVEELVSARRVRLNGQLVQKTHQLVHEGDVLTLRLQREIRIVRVRRLGERRGSARDASRLYEDLTETAAGG